MWEKVIKQEQKYRPFNKIKDYKPGALVKKDMKFIIKMGKFVNYQKIQIKREFLVPTYSN